MATKSETVVVLGATGVQGGGTARALLKDGWRVRALVRDPASARARELEAAGAELVRGDMGDRASLDRAVAGAYGVFSIQPASPQAHYGLTDDDEVRFGTSIADAAKAAGVEHFVYTSVLGLRAGTDVGHFESKWRIEEHVRASGLRATIVRPGTFMELLLMPGFGPSQGRLQFFAPPDQPMQFIAGEDIGVLVARVFADPRTHVGTTLDLAADSLTGNVLAQKIGRATGTSITYARFAPEVLEASPMLRKLVKLFDDGSVSESADIPALRRLAPGLLTFDAWLERGGAAAFKERLAA
ncbi:NmrA/HSCARG family protein [Corallococcus interemptor]|uniref:NmrA/HSCARG family protein n=1 Tax=Corallococcus interemptor TaxID=2316720 RepID=A0A3A8PXT3_9BACT|nr:NmrA/HSCARG family protein [Corallococcus interemptor]RKH52794.1 NmrA/HSCARG family protein [Corallococcus sp. AB050B]RKH61296.1 NmrA/HSCARG family protein [Corallococcus interemptor]